MSRNRHQNLGWTATRVAVPLAAGLLAASTLAPTPALADEVNPSPSTTPAAEPGAPESTADAQIPQGSADQVAIMAARRQVARVERERRLRAAVVSLARKQLGDRYIAGRAGPDSFDCSGLVRYVMGRVLGNWLPHYSRTQYRRVDRISLKHARPGDLVFYFNHGAHHVGIYVGKGQMVHAANPRAGVRIGSIRGPWYSRTFTGIGRLIPAA